MKVNLSNIDWKNVTNGYLYNDIEKVVMLYPLEYQLKVLNAIIKQLEVDVYSSKSDIEERKNLIKRNNANCFNPLMKKIKNNLFQLGKDKENDKPIEISLTNNDDSFEQIIEVQNNEIRKGISESKSLMEKLGQEIIQPFYKTKEDAEYTSEELQQLRLNKDNRLYKTPDDVNFVKPLGFIWENGKVGYFIRHDHMGLGQDFIFNNNDGHGLRFVQTDKEGNSIPLSFLNKNKILASGFSDYFLLNWGKDLSKLMDDYVQVKYKKFADDWRKKNFPNNKIDIEEIIQFLEQLKIEEKKKYEESTINNFFSKSDNHKLEQCITSFLKGIDLRIENALSKLNTTNRLIMVIQRGAYSENWVNDIPGGFVFYPNECSYLFQEMTDGLQRHIYTEEGKRKEVETASGFTAYLIKHFGEETNAIFNNYLNFRINQYKNVHKNDPDFFKRNLEKDFFEQYPKQEEQWIKKSEAIFEFITDKEVNTIKEFIHYYKDFFRNKFNPLHIEEYTKQSEIITDAEKDSRINLAYKIFLNYPETIEKYSLVTRVNDVRRILFHYVEKPDECLDFVLSKYQTAVNIGTVFIECLKLVIDNNSVFYKMLSNQPFEFHKGTQGEIRKIVENKSSFTSNTEDKTVSHEIFNLEIQPNVDKAISENKERKINIPELQSYFVLDFYDTRKNSIDLFGRLVDELEKNLKQINYAQIAYLIYTSNHMNRVKKPDKFLDWYRIFCKIIDITPSKHLGKESKVKDIKPSLKALFNYL